MSRGRTCERNEEIWPYQMPPRLKKQKARARTTVARAHSWFRGKVGSQLPQKWWSTPGNPRDSSLKRHVPQVVELRSVRRCVRYSTSFQKGHESYISMCIRQQTVNLSHPFYSLSFSFVCFQYYSYPHNWNCFVYSDIHRPLWSLGASPPAQCLNGPVLGLPVIELPASQS